MSKELRARIFSTIKSIKKDEVTLDEISAVLSDSKKDIACELDTMVKENWISKNIEDNHYIYKLKRKLDKPLKPTPKDKFARFERVELVSRHKKYMNPFFDLIPLLNQDGRGTCTGFSGAYTAWFNQLRLINPTPLTSKDIEEILRDQPVNVFDQCVMRVDILPKFTPSAEGLYDEGRRIGNVTVPEGGYIDNVCQAYKTYGYNYEKDRQTAHTSFCAPMYYPLINNNKDETISALANQAAAHRADNYLQVYTWDGLKDAIYTYGAVMTAVNIYENYTSGGAKGLLPEPRGECIGGHALCACGYDDELDVVYVIMSWGNTWSKLSGFSRNYFNYADGQAFVPVVTHDSLTDVIIPPTPDPDNHKLITISSNMLSTISVNTDVYTNTKVVKVMLHVGDTYQISCTVMNKFRIREPTSVLQMITVEEGVSTYAFTFQEQSISEYIAQKIKELMKRFHIIQKG
jgi:hypothetical protein